MNTRFMIFKENGQVIKVDNEHETYIRETEEILVWVEGHLGKDK